MNAMSRVQMFEKQSNSVGAAEVTGTSVSNMNNSSDGTLVSPSIYPSASPVPFSGVVPQMVSSSESLSFKKPQTFQYLPLLTHLLRIYHRCYLYDNFTGVRGIRRIRLLRNPSWIRLHKNT